MPNIGPFELIIVLAILLLILGASRLPKLGKSAGQSIKGFKDGLKEGVSEDPKQIDKNKQVHAEIVDEGDETGPDQS